MIYIDIDIENCHPKILEQICHHNNISTQYLSEYNNNREQHLLNVMNAYTCSRDEAKKLFLILAYYGSFENWGINANTTKEPTEFIKNYQRELINISKFIIGANVELVKIIKVLEKRIRPGQLYQYFYKKKNDKY
jgi:hypothetical protein